LLKYIRYKQDGGVEIYDGQLQVEKFVISDIIKAINSRLNSIPERKITLAYHQYCEETCFLVRLAYEIDMFEQYLEKTNDSLILNFCNENLVSYYSISFHTKENFSKEAISQKLSSIKFSDQIKAALMSLQELKEKHLPLNLYHLKSGRVFYGNNLYYKYNNLSFCLPISQMISTKEKNGEIEKYIKDIKVKIDNDKQRINIHVVALRNAYGKRDVENNYYGYLDLNKFDFIIEKQEKELLSS
jgi:hypothetical protein